MHNKRVAVSRGTSGQARQTLVLHVLQYLVVQAFGKQQAGIMLVVVFRLRLGAVGMTSSSTATNTLLMCVSLIVGMDRLVAVGDTRLGCLPWVTRHDGVTAYRGTTVDYRALQSARGSSSVHNGLLGGGGSDMVLQ